MNDEEVMMRNVEKKKKRDVQNFSDVLWKALRTPTKADTSHLPCKLPDVVALIEAYPQPQMLMKAYSPDKTSSMLNIEDKNRIFYGKAPMVVDVKLAYGVNVVCEWLTIQLQALSEYAGCRGKIEYDICHELANLLVGRYGYLRLSEFMYFIALFKTGKYGRFYGEIDPLLIGQAMEAFITERNNEMDRLDRERERQQREREQQERQAKSVSYEEYQRMKERGEIE